MSCACETPLKLGKISWDWGGGGYRLELLLLESFTPRVHHENDYVFLWMKNENYFTSMSHYCYSMPVEQNFVTMGSHRNPSPNKLSGIPFLAAQIG